MPVIYYVGQICAIIAWTLFLTSYYAKRKNKVILLQILSSIFYIVNYCCLGAEAGLWISVFELLKAIGYYKTDKDKYLFYFTLPIYLIIIWCIGFNILTVIAVLASMIDSYVVLKGKRIMVVGGIVSCAMWIVYDFCFFDFVDAIADLFIVISNLSILIRGYSKYLHRSNVYTVKLYRISMNTVNRIDKLDKKVLDKQYRWDKETIKNLTKDYPYSYVLIKDNNKVVGYINFLNLKEKIYNNMIGSHVLYDEFSEEDVINLVKNHKAFLNLNAIILDDDYYNSNTLYKIEDAIRRYVRQMRKKRYYVQELCCFAVNDLETRVLEDLEFEKIRDITNECFLYRKII